MNTTPSTARRASLLLFLVAALAVLVSGCSTETATTNKDWPTIAFLVPMDRNHEYGKNYVSSLREAAEREHVNAFVMNSNYDASVQASQMKIAIAKDVDGVVIWPAMAGAEKPMLIQAQRAGIPVTISNSQPPDDLDHSLYHAFTGPNDQRVGELQGQALASLLNDSGTFVYVGGTPGNAAAANRQIGLEREMAKHPNIKLLGSQPGNFDKNQSQTATSNLISRFGNKINAVVAADDVGSAGAAQALQAAGLNDVELIGHGFAPVAKPLIDSGALSVTLMQSPCWDSQYALTTMLDVIAGKDVPAVTYMPLPPVTQENSNEFTPYGCLPAAYANQSTSN